MAASKGIKWDEQPLGQMSDKDLAKRLQVSPEAVRMARVSRGIQSCVNKSKYIDWSTQPLGLMPDAEIAKKIGVTISSVRSARATRSIPNYGEYFHIMSDFRLKKLEKGVDAILKYLNIHPEKDA